MGWRRYAMYWAPRGELGRLGTLWLGWDIRRGQSTRQAMAEAPKARRYGFHATLKAPFALIEDMAESDARRAARSVAETLAPVPTGRLQVSSEGGFLALRPTETAGLAEVAVRLVEGLDSLRAAPSPEELARRRAAGLTPAQEEMLLRWGYPYAMAEFHPHITLSDGPAAEAEADRARQHFAEILDTPCSLEIVSLVGEDALGRFHVIEDLPLGAAGAL